MSSACGAYIYIVFSEVLESNTNTKLYYLVLKPLNSKSMGAG